MKKKTLPQVPTKTSELVIVESLKKKVAPLINKVSSIVIESEHDYEAMAELVKRIKDLDKEATKEEKWMSDPNKLALKRIKDHFRPFHISVKIVELNAKEAMLEWLEKNEKKVAKVVQMFEDGKIAKPKTYLKKLAALEITSNSSSVKNLRRVEILDEQIIPRQYPIPDYKRIEDDLKAGKKAAGCRLYNKKSISI